LESTRLITLYRENDALAKRGLLDGHHESVLKSSEELRSMIVDWYRTGLNKEMIGYDAYQVSEGSRKWVRGDVIALESANFTSKDIPESGEERVRLILHYLDHIKKPHVWGGTPEYTAFAFMAKLKIEVYNEKLEKIQEVNPPKALGTVRLLFNGSNHYDIAFSDEDKNTICEFMPHVKFVKL